jgi:hypothetical protein
VVGGGGGGEEVRHIYSVRGMRGNCLSW